MSKYYDGKDLLSEGVLTQEEYNRYFRVAGRAKVGSDIVHVSTRVGMKLESIDPWSIEPKSLLDHLALEDAKNGKLH